MLRRIDRTDYTADIPGESGLHSAQASDGSRVLWFVLTSPPQIEETEVETLIGIDVPTCDDIVDINPSSRRPREKDVVFAAARVITSNEAFRAQAESVASDIASLCDHASFVTHNAQFVLDTALGTVGAKRNAIVKFFSIVAVVHLPPTLTAGICGMNFDVMPELSWPWGYPTAILIIIASAILPYLWCRVRGWL